MQSGETVFGHAPAASATEALEASWAQYLAQPDSNAFCYLDWSVAERRAAAIDTALAARPLLGWTVSVKDNIHVAGLPCAAGTPALRDVWPSESAAVVHMMEQAGALVLGKAGMHELAYGITSMNRATGVVRNPVCPHLIAGGSSGGSAASVAAGLVRASLGTDTGGSVRIPAALTGLVGFRPSMGRYSQDGLALISGTRDTVGILARSVGDVNTVDGIIASVPLPAKSLVRPRLGVPTAHFYQHLDAYVARLDRGRASAGSR